MIVTLCYHHRMRAKTMIYLEPAQHRALKARAHADGISLAELIRRLADSHLNQSRRAVPPRAYEGVIGLAASGRDDIGDTHDRRVARALRGKHAR